MAKEKRNLDIWIFSCCRLYHIR